MKNFSLAICAVVLTACSDGKAGQALGNALPAPSETPPPHQAPLEATAEQRAGEHDVTSEQAKERAAELARYTKNRAAALAAFDKANGLH